MRSHAIVLFQKLSFLDPVLLKSQKLTTPKSQTQ